MTDKQTFREVKKRLASFDITEDDLARILQFPPGTKLERIHPSNKNMGALSLVVSHPSFPEVLWGQWIPEIEILVSEKNNQIMLDWRLPGSSADRDESIND